MIPIGAVPYVGRKQLRRSSVYSGGLWGSSCIPHDWDHVLMASPYSAA